MKFPPWICLVFLSAPLLAQNAPAAGVNSEWDVRKLLESLGAEAQHLQPIIDQVKPEEWVAKGAPAAYVAQWKSAEVQIRYLLTSTSGLARDPERLTLALDTFLRMQAIESTLASLAEGIHKSQNPALAELTQSVVAENSNNRERLRQYLIDLADQKEQEFQVADREAQRCRGLILNQPAPPRKTSRR
jgi:hypothetical protein